MSKYFIEWKKPWNALKKQRWRWKTKIIVLLLQKKVCLPIFIVTRNLMYVGHLKTKGRYQNIIILGMTVRVNDIGLINLYWETVGYVKPESKLCIPPHLDAHILNLNIRIILEYTIIAVEVKLILNENLKWKWKLNSCMHVMYVDKSIYFFSFKISHFI